MGFFLIIAAIVAILYDHVGLAVFCLFLAAMWSID